MNMLKNLALAGVFLAMATGPAMALDASEVRMMLQNGVHEDVIISMLQNDKLNAPLSAQEVVELNSMGASSTLLQYLTNPSYVNQSPVVTDSTTTYSSPSTVVTQSPTIITTEPQVIYTTPPPVVYYPNRYYYGRPYYRSGPTFSFSFGSGGRRHHGGGPRWGGPRGRPRW